MLSITNLKKTFIQPDGSPLPILDIPHFTVSAGEQVVLVGRSGGGKTTLLHNIAGITNIDSGEITFDSLPIQTLSQEMRDRFRAENMGYVFQTFNLLPAFTALENVMLGMAFCKGKTDRGFALSLLERVGLASRIGHRPTMMSVGEQQRVAVARALANQPRLLLADEPTANIDPVNQQSIVDLIKETCEEFNVGLILVTHSLEVAEQFSRVDRLEDINLVAAPAAQA